MKANFLALPVLAAAFCGAQAPAQDLGDQPLPPAAGPDLGQLERQAQGDYPLLTNQTRMVGGAIQEIWNDARPEAGVLHVKEPVGKTIKVIVREAMPLTITLPPGQKILDFSIGDQEAFGAERCPSDDGCLWVWSKHAGYDSLVSIVTRDRLVYPVYVRSEGHNSANIPHTWLRLGTTSPAFETTPLQQASAGFTPDDAPLTEAMDPAEAPTWTRSANFDPTRIKHDVEMSGDAEIAPVNVWRDDKFTWLDWGADSDPTRWPAAWEVVDGIDQPVRIRKSKDNRFLIVETTGPITLRRGEKTVCLRSKSV